jgi:hypothetical protein
MTIEITNPEVEALIESGLRETGLSKPEDLIFKALQELDLKPQVSRKNQAEFRNLAELLLNSPLAGAGIDLERTHDYPRSIEFK